MSALLLRLAQLLPSGLNPKVATTAVGGALATLILWAFALAGHPVPPEIAAAIVTVVGFAAGYLTPPAPPSRP